MRDGQAKLLLETTLNAGAYLFLDITTYEIEWMQSRMAGNRSVTIRTSREKLEQIRNSWTHAEAGIDTMGGGKSNF